MNQKRSFEVPDLAMPTRASGQYPIVRGVEDVPRSAEPTPSSGPRRCSSLEMPAVTEAGPPSLVPRVVSTGRAPKAAPAPPPTGRMLEMEDAFAEDREEVRLALQSLPPRHASQPGMAAVKAAPPPARASGTLPRTVHFTPPPMAAVSPDAVLGASVSELAPVPPPVSEPPSALAPVAAVSARRPGVFAFAGYGLTPSKATELPAYAFRVLARRRALRRELAYARTRGRAADIELYEEALEAADEAAVSKGLALATAVVGAGLAAVTACILAL